MYSRMVNINTFNAMVTLLLSDNLFRKCTFNTHEYLIEVNYVSVLCKPETGKLRPEKYLDRIATI
jgi:hypothetical protein